MIADVLPEKHVRISESLYGLGGLVLALTREAPLSLDFIWTELKKDKFLHSRIHGTVSLDKVLLALDFLFAIGAIELNNEGLVEHASR